MWAILVYILHPSRNEDLAFWNIKKHKTWWQNTAVCLAQEKKERKKERKTKEPKAQPYAPYALVSIGTSGAALV